MFFERTVINSRASSGLRQTHPVRKRRKQNIKIPRYFSACVRARAKVDFVVNNAAPRTRRRRRRRKTERFSSLERGRIAAARVPRANRPSLTYPRDCYRSRGTQISGCCFDYRRRRRRRRGDAMRSGIRTRDGADGLARARARGRKLFPRTRCCLPESYTHTRARARATLLPS